MFVWFFVLIVFYGIGKYILCCVLVVGYPGVIILLLCAIVARSFGVGAIGIGTIFGWSLLPICLLRCGILCLLYFELSGLVLFVGEGGRISVCVLQGWLCLVCVAHS